MSKCKVNVVPTSFNDILDYLTPLSLKGNLKAFTIKHLLAATVYITWMERNRRVFSSNFRTEETIFAEIERHIQLKLVCANHSFPCTSLNKNICKAWDIDHALD